MAQVLIMHADEVVRERWQDLLRRDGHSCSAADSGDRTIELLAEAGSELLLCGGWQPRPADLEFVKSIRARFPAVAIFLTSPAGDTPESRAVLDSGLAGYLVEPCSDQQVSVGVAQAVRIRSREQRLVQQQAALERAIRERNLRLGASIDKLERARKTSDELARGFEEQVQMLRVLLDTIPNPICQFDSNGIVVSCNRSWEGVVGRSAEELVGLPALRALPFDMAEEYLLGTSSSARSEGLNRELALKFADGQVHDVLVYQADYDDTAGRTAGTVVVLLDITERKQAENEVISSERYLRAILDSILAGVIVLDAGTREILDANPRAAEMLGITREEMVGRVCTDLICPSAEGHCPYAGATGRASEMERTLLKGDGSELPVMKGVTRIDLDRRSLYIESFVDLTDRKRMELALRTSEEKTRQVLENIGIGVALISPDMRVLELNRQMREWFPDPDLSHPPMCHKSFCGNSGDGSCPDCPVAETLRDGRVHEKLIKTPMGQEERHFRIVASPIRDQQGDVVAAIEMVEDYTEREVLEHDLRQAQKLESIGQLAAGIAHEINTPTQYVGDNTRFLQDAFRDVMGTLGPLRGVLDAARQGSVAAGTIQEVDTVLAEADLDYVAEEVPRAIDQTLEGIAHIMRIVRSMKEFSHPGGEGRTLTDLNRALDTTITVARNEWKYVADVEVEFDPALPPVSCFPGDLNQVFLNLLINASQAIAELNGPNRDEKGRIKVSTRLVDDQVEIRFSDTGGGIPESIRHRIFDPFFTTKEVGKGTGQGLAIAHRVIEKHKGTLAFETEEGRGTTFIIRIPTQVEEQEEAA